MVTTVTYLKKSDRLASAHRKLDQFVAAGGNLTTPAAVAIRQEFEDAFKELYGEFGSAPENPYNKRGITFI
jgi:hypothetical protein